jgi:RHS repeat-associated protein
LIEYVLDGFGRRIGRKRNGVLSEAFLFMDGLNPVAMMDSLGETTHLFIYGAQGNVPDYMIRGGVRYRLITDHLGSVRLVVDATSGDVIQRIDYDPWGNHIVDTNPGFQPFGFAGGIYDSETELTLFGARTYDGASGRWMSKDPILFHGGVSNLYEYALNDPIDYIDPSGTQQLLPPPLGPFPPSVVGREFLENWYATSKWGALDQYFHCRANCEAAQTGPVGEELAEILTELKERFDRAIDRWDPFDPEDSAADQQANRCGRYLGRHNPLGDCNALCGSYYSPIHSFPPLYDFL